MPRLTKNPTQEVLIDAAYVHFAKAMIEGDANTVDLLLEVAKRWEYIATVTCRGERIPKTVDFMAVSQNPDYQKWLKDNDDKETKLSILRETFAFQNSRILVLEDEKKVLQDKLDKAMERLIRLETK